MRGRLLDWNLGLYEEKGQRWALRQWVHLRVAEAEVDEEVVAAVAVKRNIVARDGDEVRNVAMSVERVSRC